MLLFLFLILSLLLIGIAMEGSGYSSLRGVEVHCGMRLGHCDNVSYCPEAECCAIV